MIANLLRRSILIFITGFTGGVYAQSTAGITGTADTSYTTHSAYKSTVKDFPDIEVVREMKLASVAEKRNITYCNIGGRSLLIDAFYPKENSKKGRIAVIMIHGGGWRSGNRSQHYPLAQQLAKRGFVCLTPEYRLSTEALYPAAIFDIKAVIRWVNAHAKQFGIDTGKIAIAGFSAGGELAAFIGTTIGKPDFEGMGCTDGVDGKVHVIVDIDGTLSFVHADSGEGDDSKRTSAATYWFGYSKKENDALWQDASPLKWVDKNTPPTLFINSAAERMHAGREDFIKVLNKNNIYSEIKTFEAAPHSFCLFNPWFNPTIEYIDQFLKKVFPKNFVDMSKSFVIICFFIFGSYVGSYCQTANAKQYKYIFTVAKDGTGDFKYIQDAIDAMRVYPLEPIALYIKNGVYTEKIELPANNTDVTFVGESVDKTIISFNDYSGRGKLQTFTSFTAKISGNRFTAINITFANTAGPVGQAVALYVDADMATFKNCRFLGNQDTIYAAGETSRQLFADCYIEGTTDFIFGPSTAVFQNCTIKAKTNSYITAANTPPGRTIWICIF